MRSGTGPLKAKDVFDVSSDEDAVPQSRHSRAPKSSAHEPSCTKPSHSSSIRQKALIRTAIARTKDVTKKRSGRRQTSHELVSSDIKSSSEPMNGILDASQSNEETVVVEKRVVSDSARDLLLVADEAKNIGGNSVGRRRRTLPPTRIERSVSLHILQGSSASQQKPAVSQARSKQRSLHAHTPLPKRPSAISFANGTEGTALQKGSGRLVAESSKPVQPMTIVFSKDNPLPSITSADPSLSPKVSETGINITSPLLDSHLSTPGSSADSEKSPGQNVIAGGALHGSTSRQKSLWNKLLNDSDDEDISYSSHLQCSRQNTSTRESLRLPRSYSDITGLMPRKRAKLVDGLRTSMTAAAWPDEHGTESPINMWLEKPAVTTESQRSSMHQAGNLTCQRSARITYGQQRSRIADDIEDENSLIDMLFEDISQSLLPTLEKTRTNDGFDFDHDEEEGEEAGQPKSAHDLRATGSKKRLLQDIESLVAGVDDETLTSMGSKRSDLIELVQKCLEAGVVDLILDHDLDRQLLATFVKSSDTIFNFLAATCLSLIIRNTKQATVIRGVNRSGFIPRLVDLLDIEQDIVHLARQRRFNISSLAQKKIHLLRGQLLESDLWSTIRPTQLSPQLVALQTLVFLIRQSRELGTDNPPFEDGLLPRIFQIIHGRSCTSSARGQIELVISLFDTTLVGRNSSLDSFWSNRVVDTIAKLLPELLAESTCISSESQHDALRLSLNLTNNNPEACRTLAREQLILPLLQIILAGFEASTCMPVIIMEGLPNDKFILALGAMINLAELSVEARSIIHIHAFSILESLIDIFSSAHAMADANSVETFGNNVSIGYLALLLINLCQSDELRQKIIQLFPGAALQGLTEIAERFIVIHQKTDREMLSHTSEIGNDSKHQTGYIQRLQDMVRRLKDTAILKNETRCYID